VAPETQEDSRSLAENYDGEYSAWEGRSQAGTGEVFADVFERRLGRRGAFKAGIVLTAAAAAAARPPAAEAAPADATAAQARPVSTLTFASIPLDTTDQISLPAGYTYDRVMSWGDPLHPGVPAFDFDRQSPALQELQAGFNCDFLWFLPLPAGSNNPNEGLLWNNHEYTDGVMMFREYRGTGTGGSTRPPTQEQVDIEHAAHGATIMHVRRNRDGRWAYVLDSKYNRRITGTTPIRISGPAAGDPYLRTSADPNGTAVLGMLNNCGGGWTPWGTVLSAEENFNQYFANRNRLGGDHPLQASHTRLGPAGGASDRAWEIYHDRFDVAKEPNEPNRFGWIVEVDPYDPASQPIKRTALGRMKHEAAAGTLAPNGRWVSYCGDDERFEYIYKFVSAQPYIPGNKAHNLTLLDQGTLYAARFDDDGTGTWLPLVWNRGPLIAANGFFSQADVLIRARMAGDALGATKMDRPEDVEVNPLNKKVYVVCTFNERRGSGGSNAGTDGPNHVAENYNGHVLEITEDRDDHAGTSFRWTVFLQCGDPADPNTYFAGFPKEQVAAVSAPDNIAFDARGNLWIATDGQVRSDAFRGPNVPGKASTDSIYAVAVAGPERGKTKRLVNGVPGGEIASLTFNPDSTALFLSIQHPGEGGTFARPVSHFPDGGDLVARPTVIAVRRMDGRAVGT
jgi:secreted PhoX family phosphatase